MEDYKTSIDLRDFILKAVKSAKESGELTADQVVSYIDISGKMVSMFTPKL